MANVKIVRRASLTLDEASYDIISYTSGAAKSVDVIDVTCLGDAKHKKVGGCVVRNDDIEFEVSGELDPNFFVDNKKIVTALTINGVSTSLGNTIMRSCTPHEIEVEGNRVQAWDIVLTPAVGGTLVEG